MSKESPDSLLFLRISILVHKSVAHFKRHGIRRTVHRIWQKLKGSTTERSMMQTFPPTADLGLDQGMSPLNKVSFMIGMKGGESKRYRVYNIVEGLQRRGITCCVFFEENADVLEQVADSNVAIIFRARMSARVRCVIERLSSFDVPIIFDIDDLVFDPEHVSELDVARRLPAGLQQAFKYDFLLHKQVLDMCPFATCSTKVLADIIRQTGKKSFVVPNTVNRAQFELSSAIQKDTNGKVAGKVKISYFSGTNTHEGDFLEVSRALVEVLEKYRNAELHVIGPLEMPLSLKKYESVVKRPIMPYLEMLKYASQMDINLAPLEQNNLFNDAKSELKIFESALVGVPTIASRTRTYSECISDGENGFLAGTHEEWMRKLICLMDDGELRAQVGRNANRDFISRFYIDNIIDEIIKIYANISRTRNNTLD